MKVYRFKCKDCGATKYEKVDENTYMCQYCGFVEEVHREKPKEEETNEQTPDVEVEFIPEINHTNHKSTRLIVLLIACILGGTIGVHRFMQGKILSGLVYLFTFGLFGVGIFFDMIGIIIKLAHAPKEEYVSYRKVIKERDDND